jgi:hypothetical protein
MIIEEPVTSYKQEFLIYPSISLTGEYHSPIEDIEIGDSIIRTEDVDKLITFYNKHKPAFDTFGKTNAMVICVNDDLSSYTKAMVNLVELSYKHNNIKILLTNYTLIESLEQGNKNFRVYLFEPNELVFNRMDYVVKLDEYRRRIYFEQLRKSYLVEVIVDEKFLEMRKDFLNGVSSDGFTKLFRDPVGNQIIDNRLDIMVLHVPEVFKDSYGVPINIDYYEKRINKNVFNRSVTFISYTQSEDFYHDLIKNYGNNGDFVNRDSNGLFVENERSINFGHVDVLSESGFGKFTLFNNTTGQLLIDMEELVPLGLAYSKPYHNNNHVFLNSARGDYNLILPFTNQGLIHLFKRLLNKNHSSMDIIPDNNPFKMTKDPKYKCIDFIKTKHVEYKLPKARGYTEEKVETAYPSTVPRKRPESKKFLHTIPDLLSNPKYAKIIKQIQYKLKFKRFHYDRFNSYLEEREKEKHK